MGRIVIIDPDFEQLGGHNIAANEIIRSHTDAPMDIVCASSLPDEIGLEGATLNRVLPFNSYEAYTRYSSPLNRTARWLRKLLRGQPGPDLDETGFGRELLRVFQSVNISSRDAIVVHTGSAVLLNAIMDALAMFAEADWPELHFRQVRPLDNIAYERAIHDRAQRMKRLGKLFMYS